MRLQESHALIDLVALLTLLARLQRLTNMIRATDEEPPIYPSSLNQLRTKAAPPFDQVGSGFPFFRFQPLGVNSTFLSSEVREQATHLSIGSGQRAHDFERGPG